MPDTAHARLALRRLVAGLISSRPPLRGHELLAPSASMTIDDWLACLDTDEAADLTAVSEALDYAAAVIEIGEHAPRFVYAEKDRDYRTGAARGYLVLDLLAVDRDNSEAELFAACPSEVNARTLAAVLNEHPPRFSPDTPAGYDVEPF